MGHIQLSGAMAGANKGSPSSVKRIPLCALSMGSVEGGRCSGEFPVFRERRGEEKLFHQGSEIKCLY